PEYFFSPGSTRTVDGMLACAAELRTQPCDDVLRSKELPCQTPGTLAAGAPCLSGVSCATRTCSPFTGHACGTCAGFYAPDASCETFSPSFVCHLDETCDPVTKRCAPTRDGNVAQGGACSAVVGCAPDLLCLGGSADA